MERIIYGSSPKKKLQYVSLVFSFKLLCFSCGYPLDHSCYKKAVFIYKTKHIKLDIWTVYNFLFATLVHSYREQWYYLVCLLSDSSHIFFLVTISSPFLVNLVQCYSCILSYEAIYTNLFPLFIMLYHLFSLCQSWLVWEAEIALWLTFWEFNFSQHV